MKQARKPIESEMRKSILAMDTKTLNYERVAVTTATLLIMVS